MIIHNLIVVQDHVARCYPSDPDSWDLVMDRLKELLTSADMKRLKQYCDKRNRRFHRGDKSLYEEWKWRFTGEAVYHKIFTGLSGEERPEMSETGYDSDNLDPGMFDGFENSGEDYFLAYHQWNAFEKWLTVHPECAAHVSAFKVSHLLYLSSNECS